MVRVHYRLPPFIAHKEMQCRHLIPSLALLFGVRGVQKVPDVWGYPDNLEFIYDEERRGTISLIGQTFIGMILWLLAWVAAVS